MDGEIPDFEVLEKLKDQFDFFLIADEAHAFGILGEKGRGLACGHADITIGTFGKALGLFGAFDLLPMIIKKNTFLIFAFL